MGKMKEIAQIHFDWQPHIPLKELLNTDEYYNFLNVFKRNKENMILNESLRWTIGEYNSFEIPSKINTALFIMGFKSKDIVYLDL